MLIEFSVANYRSFRDRVTLSMVAAPIKSKYPELDQNNTFVADGNLRLLTSAAVYGANASGKSNLITGLAFMRKFVMNSQKSTERIGGISVEPFLLCTENVDSPSFFEVVFFLDGQRYRYGFELTTERVETEWLYMVPTTREAKLFEREGDEIELGPRFRAEGKNFKDSTRPNALFLSVVAQFDGKIAQKVLKWFRSYNVISGLTDTAFRAYTEQKLVATDEVSDRIIHLLRQFDLSIDDVEVEKTSPSLPTLPEKAPAELHDAITTIMGYIKQASEQIEDVSIKTYHRRFDAANQHVDKVVFNLDEHESEGTKKLISLSGPLVDTLQRGRILIVDELDARLHPLLTQKIIRLFNDPRSNPNHAQLIFATHDTNLLDNHLLRRDQIWFTEKDRQGASHLYSLADFKVRNDASFEKDYIQGRFGAIPYLGNLHFIVEDASL